MKRQKETPGAILKIAFDQPWHTYGRMLRFGDVAVYDCRTTEDVADMDYIIQQPIIFKGIVNEGAVKYGRWPIIGTLPLEDALRHSKYFLEEIGDPNSFKLIQNGGISFGHPRSAIVGLTFGGIWDAMHVEEILRDYYTGRKNISLDLYYTKIGLSLPAY
jgi:hypothetical protein